MIKNYEQKLVEWIKRTLPRLSKTEALEYAMVDIQLKYALPDHEIEEERAYVWELICNHY